MTDMSMEVQTERRYKVRFPDKPHFRAAMATQAPGIETPVINPERLVISVREPLLKMANVQEYFSNQMRILTEEYGARVTIDYQYDIEEIFDPTKFGPDSPKNPSLDDVLRMIDAPRAWNHNRGNGATIAIVDTGINGTRNEFGSARRAGGWATPTNDPWTDPYGHGTMCASIAAGSVADGGAFNGVAPEARILACRTGFFDTELTAIYQMLRDRARKGELIVASNSFGHRQGTPPDPPEVDFLAAMDEAIDAGVFVVFSAGNNHELAGGAPDACHPNSIWAHKDREDVLAVATCRLNSEMWEYSSRGPGEHVGDAGYRSKPDVTAPTPRDGRVLYGDQVVSMPIGWGTSGACPQVAGLAALLRTKNPAATVTEIQQAIIGTARTLGHAATCEGAGIIDCGSAIAGI